MPTYYDKISSVTVGSGGASSVTFSSIPGTYTNLCIKLSLRLTNAVDVYGMVVSINGAATGSGYNWKRLLSDGSSVSTTSGTSAYSGDVQGASYTANTFGNMEIYIPYYTSSTNKPMSIDYVTENNGVAAYSAMIPLLRNNTAAITSLSFSTAGTFAQYSSATLYGIL